MLPYAASLVLPRALGGDINGGVDAVKQARMALNLTGFVAIGGKSATGKALYAKAKALLK